MNLPPTDDEMNAYLAQFPHSERDALNIIAQALAGIRYDLGAIRELMQDRL